MCRAMLLLTVVRSGAVWGQYGVGRARSVRRGSSSCLFLGSFFGPNKEGGREAFELRMRKLLEGGWLDMLAEAEPGCGLAPGTEGGDVSREAAGWHPERAEGGEGGDASREAASWHLGALPSAYLGRVTKT